MLKPISIKLLFIILMIISSCKKDDCQTCTKTIGGVAGNSTEEIREVCDEREAERLEGSSQSTTVWDCK